MPYYPPNTGGGGGVGPEGPQGPAGPPGEPGKDGIGEDITVDSDYSSLNEALENTPEDGVLEIRSEWTTPLVINKPVKVRFTRTGRIDIPARGKAIDIQSSNVTIEDPWLVGSGSGTAGNSYGIYSLAPSFAEPYTNIVIRRPRITNCDYDAIMLKYVRNFKIIDPAIQDFSYAGIMIISSVNGDILGGYVRDAAMPAPLVNAYGIALTRNYGPLNLEPKTSNVRVNNVWVDNIYGWEGIDTHGGDDLEISNNRVTRCSVGIAMVPCPATSGGEDILAPTNIRVVNNYIDGGRTDGGGKAGIQVVGASKGLGPSNVNEYATGVIMGNTILRHGTDTSSRGGAIFLESTKGLIVANNRIEEASISGIVVYHDNNGLVAANNTIVDVWTNSLGFSAGIYVSSDYNTAIFANNFGTRGTKTASIVNDRGIFVAASLSNNKLTDGGGNDFSSFASPIVGYTPAGRSDVQVFTSNGTWNKPSNASAVRSVLIGGGGGGGSGCRGAASTIRCGGGGGGGAAVTQASFDPADLTSSAVVIGAGGTGGGAVSADSTFGSAGTIGGSTRFGVYSVAFGGSAGAGGTANSGTGGAGGVGSNIGASGGSASATGAAGGAGALAAGGGGGGAGGGITSANAANNGGVGTVSRSSSASGSSAGGTVDNVPPSVGPVVPVKGAAGCGGGGGAASITQDAQTGAAGSGYGAGGGGGGAALNGFQSGAGGAGSPGYALIISTF